MTQGSLWRSLRRNPLTIMGGGVVLFLFVIVITTPFLPIHDPYTIHADAVLQRPSSSFPLGTDELGRDVLSRVIHGARISLLVGFVSVGIAVLIGTLLGSVAGYYGGWVDGLTMRFVDVMLCFPTFFLILAVIAFLEPSIWIIMAVIGVTSWMGVCRLVRAEFLSLKERDFVQSARALGVSNVGIILRHILPNSLTPIMIAAILGIAGAILTESALSFLGIGVQPPTPSWGNILTSGKDNIQIAWWLSLFPGLAILVTVLAYNLLGEGLRDALDPRLRGSRLRA
jgi:peptide/nickel transport system permease protein